MNNISAYRNALGHKQELVNKNSLDDIAKYHGTDKSSETHNYCKKYQKYFPYNRYDSLKILEIGIWEGESLRMWKDYYSNSTIIGIDINKDCLIHKNENQKIFVEIGSQNDKSFLEYIMNKWGPFDLIIDDGSHMNSDVIFSFINLFDSVKNHGIYVVEDSCCSYWNNYGGGFRNENGSVEFFKNLIDDVNFNGEYSNTFWNVLARREDYLTQHINNIGLDIRTDIESINFMNSIILITKR